MIKNGIPAEMAFRLSEEKRTAWSIVFSEFEGAEFDWNAFKFKEQSNENPA